MSGKSLLAEFGKNLLAFLLTIVFAVIGFFFTIFVVDWGAALAGRSPTADFAVLSAALLVAASIAAGKGSALSYMAQPIEARERDED